MSNAGVRGGGARLRRAGTHAIAASVTRGPRHGGAAVVRGRWLEAGCLRAGGRCCGGADRGAVRGSRARQRRDSGRWARGPLLSRVQLHVAGYRIMRGDCCRGEDTRVGGTARGLGENVIGRRARLSGLGCHSDPLSGGRLQKCVAKACLFRVAADEYPARPASNVAATTNTCTWLATQFLTERTCSSNWLTRRRSRRQQGRPLPGCSRVHQRRSCLDREKADALLANLEERQRRGRPARLHRLASARLPTRRNRPSAWLRSPPALARGSGSRLAKRGANQRSCIRRA